MPCPAIARMISGAPRLGSQGNTNAWSQDRSMSTLTAARDEKGVRGAPLLFTLRSEDDRACASTPQHRATRCCPYLASKTAEGGWTTTTGSLACTHATAYQSIVGWARLARRCRCRRRCPDGCTTSQQQGTALHLIGSTRLQHSTGAACLGFINISCRLICIKFP